MQALKQTSELNSNTAANILTILGVDQLESDSNSFDLKKALFKQADQDKTPDLQSVINFFEKYK